MSNPTTTAGLNFPLNLSMKNLDIIIKKHIAIKHEEISIKVVTISP